MNVNPAVNPQAEGNVLQPKKPDLIRDVVQSLGKEVHDQVVKWAAKKLDKMEVEVEGLLRSGKLAVIEEPLGNNRIRISLYERIGDIVLSAKVKVEEDNKF